ncbi:MAG: phosphonate ABC transporter, permease protein PhnE [Devosia sp.]|uniref:phosphonate ABC transporter, permease protein PhnE n=1 Tax=Devosia sp. TaxID=1871048 RepID=UPI001AC92BB9|nr:phosphonate ABC transporter, permease protein PhnE [Devosia sp.]MBN9317870.1 phosphonate ABC transporter, permease protein PhnE [Devosia sp.]
MPEVAVGIDVRQHSLDLFRRKRLFSLGVPLIVLAYLAYIFVTFDFAGVASRANPDNARTLIGDSYSYKTHVTRDNRSGAFSIAIEGETKGTYPPGMSPEWVKVDDDNAVVELEGGASVEFIGDRVRMTLPGYGVIEVTSGSGGIDLVLPTDVVPDWINASNTRVSITTPSGRVQVTRSKTDVFRYAFGWELFFFTLDSPFYGRSFGELGALIVSPVEIVPGKPNLVAMAEEFWTNKMWRHGDVAWALFETVLMAFLGTFGAALIALPVAFLAASNFTPSRWIRFAFRRVFDFLRGVDGLIWTIILSRAFGPGPMTGALAILLTDTGSFGKLFSEALENVDDRQIEGVQSTGASTLQRQRFGVMPQITPVLLSQLLYYFESNTRSATVIGAIVGGGIGLLLTQAISTQKDWEEVTYYIVLIVVMVMTIDGISAWLRRRLISGAPALH